MTAVNPKDEHRCTPSIAEISGYNLRIYGNKESVILAEERAKHTQ